MDPLTLLAAATAAVNAVKQGCELYKEAKNVAGNVKEVLEDLRQQFNSKPRTKEEKQQYDQEVARVKATAQIDAGDQIAVISDHLGKFFDAYDSIEKLFFEEERNAKKVYTGDNSISRRALQRVLVRTRLEQMQAEIREEMVYRTPPELKDLWSRFEKMRKQIIAEQKEAQLEEWREQQKKEQIRQRRWEELKANALWVGAVAFIVAWLIAVLLAIRLTATYRGFFSSASL